MGSDGEAMIFDEEKKQHELNEKIKRAEQKFREISQ